MGTAGASVNMLFNALDPEFGFDLVLLEERVAPLQLIRRRVRRLGAATVFGQLLFLSGVRPIMHARSRTRREEIARAASLDLGQIDPDRVRRVRSVNDDATQQILLSTAPRVILVCGTRLLSRALLERVPAPFINAHAGVTPLYRGVHGAYWALVCGDVEHCGATVHVVDPGVDTGPVLDWAPIAPGPRDDFTTYPLLQLVAALPLIRAQLRLALLGQLRPVTPPTGRSRVWSHPTLWGYLWRRARRGIR